MAEEMVSAPPTDLQYTCFVSHAGEDKATIAIPLRQMLISHGIKTFVDEEDIPYGSDAKDAMVMAMNTADVAVIVLSPEYVAKKWPMKELMHFLRRREENSRHDIVLPVIIPFFYRLSVAELYEEPRLDRVDSNGNPMYHESRFFERMKKREPEANVENIKAALEKLHGFMGVRNYLDASNESTHVMHRRRKLLMREVYEAVSTVVKDTCPADSGTGGNVVSGARPEPEEPPVRRQEGGKGDSSESVQSKRTKTLHSRKRDRLPHPACRTDLSTGGNVVSDAGPKPRGAAGARSGGGYRITSGSRFRDRLPRPAMAS